MNKYKLKIYPKGRGREVYRVITIAGNKKLDNLCRSILDAFDFSDDHLYEFCMDNKMYSQNAIEPPATKITLDKLDLIKGQKFLLHYDFGDDWQFVITVQAVERIEKTEKTTIIKSVGTIEQYSFWEEDFEEDVNSEFSYPN